MGAESESPAAGASPGRGSSGIAPRTVLKGFAAGASVGATAGVVAASPAAAASAVPAAPVAGAGSDDWAAFDRLIGKAFDQMEMVGAAVAVVSADRVLHVTPLGSRSLRPRRPVTPDTRFLVASTTKSMSALLVATYIDEGRLAWDQPVIDAWSGFRAPTDKLTRALRVRDLLGMASGLGEPPALSALHEGDPTAAQLLQSIVNLPVIGAPDEKYFYNNTVYAVGGYLPFLAAGVAPADLPATYAKAMRDRLYQPAGMTNARIADDPRGLVDDYATGYVPDLKGNPQTLPYGPVGSYAPVGGTLASVTDMAAYVRLQLRQGLSTTGARVVSAVNLAELWKAHVTIGTSPELAPMRSSRATPWAGSGRSTRTAPRWCGTTGESTGSLPTSASCRSTTSGSWC
jgi:CubicO group peptidase (beta-lactamase class C family)